MAEVVEVRRTEYRRMPAAVCQHNQTVRVFRHTPDRVELQIRHPKHYMHATLTSEEARSIAAALLDAAVSADA